MFLAFEPVAKLLVECDADDQGAFRYPCEIPVVAARTIAEACLVPVESEAGDEQDVEFVGRDMAQALAAARGK